MQRFQVPYNVKEIPEIQEYLKFAFEESKRSGDIQDLYRRRYAHFIPSIHWHLLIWYDSLMVEPRRPADQPPTSDVSKLFGWTIRSQPTPISAS